NELKDFQDEIEKLNENVEFINQKGALLLQSSTSDSNDNPVERLLETINRSYDTLASKLKTPLNDSNQIESSTTTTITTDD
ncbi:unnamed protein product, partial [Rotaria magnacalcarata]